MQTLLDKLNIRQEKGREIAAAVRDSSFCVDGYDRRELIGLAERIAACNSKSNAFRCDEAINFETGELYESIGSLWQCGSKLCPQCLAKQSQRNRKKLREAMQNAELMRGERIRFITLTITNPKLSLRQTRDIVNRAWSMFRKRRLCVDLWRGGAKAEEFTVTRSGYHYHLHLLVIAKYAFFHEYRRVWTECVEKAFEEAGKEFEPGTKDGYLIVKVLDVNSREAAINEVCKYITKADSWQKLPLTALAQIGLIRRWHRMFELFGCLADRSKEQAKEQKAMQANTPILDTTNISDGEADSREEYWRDYVSKYGPEAYLSHLNREIERTQRIRRDQIQRRWPHATVEFFADNA